MTFSEEDLMPLSALQHFVFCPRQCALIHVEQLWTENLFTAQGRVMHVRVHEDGRESRGNVRMERGVPLRSMRLGLSGKADVVEFHRNMDKSWSPYPVEYKRGKPKQGECDLVQLCAQAICLEEMLTVDIPAGSLFYGKTRRRIEICFDGPLRLKTEETAAQVRKLIDSGITPPPVYSPKCKSCSLIGLCLPKTAGNDRKVEHYLVEIMEGQ